MAAMALLVVVSAGCEKGSLDPDVYLGDVAGTVRDADGKIVPEVVITCSGLVDTADSRGSYMITGIPEGFRGLRAEKSGFIKYTTTVKIEHHTDHDISLERQPDLNSVFGKVAVEGSGVSVEGVLIECGVRKAVTNAQGEYRIDSLVDGTYTLTATKHRWLQYETQLEILDSVIHDVNMASSRVFGHVFSNVDGPIAGAKVEINLYSGETDENGRFDFPYVPQGVFPVSVSHPDYLDNEFLATIQDFMPEQGFRLKRWVKDTTAIVNDVNITDADLDDCPDCPTWSRVTSGDNYDEYLRLEYFMRPAEAGSGPHYARTRFLVQLPAPGDHIALEDIQAAELNLIARQESYQPGPITVRRARGDNPAWSESSVNWDLAPSVSSLMFSYGEIQSGVLKLDVTSVYSDPRDALHTLRFQKEETGLADPAEFIHFWSSEASDPSLRPFVVLEYVY